MSKNQPDLFDLLFDEAFADKPEIPRGAKVLVENNENPLLHGRKGIASGFMVLQDCTLAFVSWPDGGWTLFNVNDLVLV